MQKRVKIALAILVAAVVSVAAWQGLREREPVYREKGLRVWLREYEQSYQLKSPAAIAAVRQIGTNAIPTLLNLLCEKDSAFISTLIRLWDRRVTRMNYLPDWVRSPGWYRNQAADRNVLGADGFEILGPAARDAVPALIGIYERNISPMSQRATCAALILMGPAGRTAISSFVRGAISTNAEVRLVAVQALSEVHAEPQLVVPALVQSLSDTLVPIRFAAARGLGTFGAEAHQAVPALALSLSDSSKQVRSAAANSLRQIDAEAAAKAGVK